MKRQNHWEHIYSSKAIDAVSWFQPHAARSLHFIESIAMNSASIIDVGGGASTLIDDLLARGYHQLTVLDISESALRAAQQRLGKNADAVTWITSDIINANLPESAYDVWHDRAVFHFLTDVNDRGVYVQIASCTIKPGGYLLIATFAEDGPERCSGLPIMRYSASALEQEFGQNFELISHQYETHRTPFDTTQKFIYCLFRKKLP